ncbi:MAG TPA: L-rhamnose isomerase [Candidatus Ornithospirochaeta avicola]|uniref:L-rhamnose isomerase n=1 Tax=Candidatus Ornithospirochaeta avicola TaxID=2840896 RepID=A0A9D1PSA1_9SPIO|nr:L-rhamnose isomerase [Candidatus Ornithospirochaeta avicola]
MYKDAMEKFKAFGIDTEKAISTLSSVPVSIHCWQADDVMGFEKNRGALSGGIQTTGDYPGRARNFEEMKEDLDYALSLIPGKKRINIHASYKTSDSTHDRNELDAEDFRLWIEYARARNLALDFNPTFFSHPMVKDNLTLSSPVEEVRRFWIEHGKRCRKIASVFAKELGSYSVCNLWIPDGYKEIPADRIGPRKRLKESLDEIYSEPLEGVIDAVESKVFGIGLESFTVGSNEFYLSYASRHKGVYQLLDNGHYHPTEMVSEKISALLTFFDKLPLHVTRPVRWDSDHVVRLDDEIIEIAKEIVRCNALERVLIALDYFDASVNRIAAWVVGVRSTQKALLLALLEPSKELKEAEEKADWTKMLALSEEVKMLPYSDVWEEYLKREGLESGFSWYESIMEYEKNVLSKRV